MIDFGVDWAYAIRLIAAATLGALIGLEREIHDHPAGMRTHLLVSLGSAGFTVLSDALDALDRAGLLAVPRADAEVPAWVAVHGAAILLGEGMLPRDDRESIIEATIDMVGDGLLRPQPRA